VAHSKLAIFRRRLFTLCSAISLILCLATIALWTRSYHTGWGEISVTGSRAAGYYSNRDHIMLIWMPEGPYAHWPPAETRYLTLRYRWLVLATALLPALWTALFIVRKHKRLAWRGFQVELKE
jgi:hypothetical protein